MYVKSLVGAALAIAGGLGLILLLSPMLGSGAGLGVMLIYLAFSRARPSRWPGLPASPRARAMYGTP